MRNKKQNMIVIILAGLLLFSSLAASTPNIGLLLEQADTSAFPQVEISLSAWNAAGLPLLNLDKSHFSIQEQGGAAFVPDTVRMDANAPLAVALVLDISGSMLGQPITDARVAAARFLDRLSTGDQAALVAFSDNIDPDPLVLDPNRELPFNTNFAPLYDTIESLQPQGGTHLYNAVAKAVALTQNLPAGHRAILVLSDGVNEPADVGDPDAPIQLAQAAGLPIYVIGLGNRIDEPYLRRLTSETGGLLRLAPSSAELAQTFDDMAALLKTQYTLSYTSQLTEGAASADVAVTLKQGAAKAVQNFTLKNLPALPTQMPEPSATATAIPPTATPIPPQPTPQPEPPDTPTLMSFLRAIPLYVWVIGLVLLGALLTLLLRLKRRSHSTQEKCARCGYTLPEGAQSCPQCGEARHYRVKEK